MVLQMVIVVLSWSPIFPKYVAGKPPSVHRKYDLTEQSQTWPSAIPVMLPIALCGLYIGRTDHHSLQTQETSADES